MDDVEDEVREFYDKFGWVEDGGASGEDKLFRSFSPSYYPYHETITDRTIGTFSGLSGKLLLAGGGDLPDSHLRVARQFHSTHCIDISQAALDIVKKKLGDAELILGSILDIPLPDNTFDAVFCAHVIYHVDKDFQQQAVNELIRVTRPGGRVVIIYSNPDSLPRRIVSRKNKIPLLWKLRRRGSDVPDDGPPLYFGTHSLGWWERFGESCSVNFLPWDVMANSQERSLLLFDFAAKIFYSFCSWFERKYPDRAVRWWEYPIIVIEKRSI